MKINRKKYYDYLYYLSCIKSFFIPMSVLGIALGLITEPRFLILGISPVILMGIIATVISIIAIICLFIIKWKLRRTYEQ